MLSSKGGSTLSRRTNAWDLGGDSLSMLSPAGIR